MFSLDLLFQASPDRLLLIAVTLIAFLLAIQYRNINAKLMEDEIKAPIDCIPIEVDLEGEKLFGEIVAFFLMLGFFLILGCTTYVG